MPADADGPRPDAAPDQWQGLEQWLEPAACADLAGREFPGDVSQWAEALTRRQFMTLAGASLALAGAGGCSPRTAPPEKILPYVRQPEEITLGVPLYFATAMPLAGDAIGLLVQSREGRPIKVEGNPDHPASLGATDLFAQASILDLYDPDRSQAVTHLGQPRAWNEVVSALRTALHKQRPSRGAGLRILTETVTSPTLAAQFETLVGQYPDARWVQYEPAGRHAAAGGARLAFGEPANAVYDFTQADVILSLDADFLARGPGSVRYTHDFVSRRRVRVRPENGKDGVPPERVSRLYVAETMLTNTGASADHRLPLKPSDVVASAGALAAQLGVANLRPPTPPARLPEAARGWLAPLAADLKRAGKNALVVVGDGQPAAVHAVAHALNHTLGAVGTTVRYTDPVEPKPSDQLADFRRLVEDMRAGHVELLLILGGNPVYTAPVDLAFADALEKVPLRAHLGLYQDETAVLCHWHVPAAHYLESWGDARCFDGTASLIQPLIAPLYGGRSAIELMAVLTEQPERTGYEIVRGHWRDARRQQGDSTDFEAFWHQAVRRGVVPGTALPRKDVTLRDDWAARLTGEPGASATGGHLELAFRPDPTIWDGRFANNAWLQELPKPVTRLTWDNAVFLSPQTARDLGLSIGTDFTGGEHGHGVADVVELTFRGRTMRAPAWVVPGHADGAVTVTLGYGRERAGRVGDGHGFNAYAIRTADAPWSGDGLQVARTGERVPLACVQMHHGMAGRRPVRHATPAEFRKDPDFATIPPTAKSLRHEINALVPGPRDRNRGPESAGEPRDRRLTPLTLYPERPPAEHRWAMAIDLSACVGCGACVVACQAENNIPVVGKSEVLRGREMHWLRVDRYYEGDPESETGLTNFFQPVPCMHCENAPCEVVCPVAATVHSDDGLNDMVYNRCVGTRYCSNNCPYKVRRFNFLQYSDYATESLKLLHNPEVTVRSRGVMEKCTYCVQRIRNAEIVAARDRRPIADGDIRTACQAACPAEAIVFGDLNDAAGIATRWKAEPHNYGLLAELNTQPRTTYLAALRNPNPAMPRTV